MNIPLMVDFLTSGVTASQLKNVSPTRSINDSNRASVITDDVITGIHNDIIVNSTLPAPASGFAGSTGILQIALLSSLFRTSTTVCFAP